MFRMWSKNQYGGRELDMEVDLRYFDDLTNRLLSHGVKEVTIQRVYDGGGFEVVADGRKYRKRPGDSWEDFKKKVNLEEFRMKNENKTFNIEEALRMVRNDKSLSFVRVEPHGRKLTLGLCGSEIYLELEDESDGTYKRMVLEDMNEGGEWNRAEKPVHWKDAFQARVDGKDIRCELDGRVYPFMAGKDLYLVGELLERGKWYVEGV